jgi:glycosidase
MVLLTACISQIVFLELPAAACSGFEKFEGAPIVKKIEPPNWWVGLRPNLMLLVSGENLEGASVSINWAGVRLTQSKASANGKYLFIWLEIAPNAQLGVVTLQIDTPGGRAVVKFQLSGREPGQGKFRGFGRDDVMYLIMIDRFADGDTSNDELADLPGSYDRANPRAYHGGDFRGIRDHLDYLRDLGVTTLWLTPVVKNGRSPQDYHGYGAVDEYAVNDHFGTLADLQDLVRVAHEKGLKVLFDFVPNHVGPHHPWVDALPEPDWFHGTKEHHMTASDNFRFLADPHAPPRYSRDVIEGWFAGILPDLNQENPQVAAYFIQNAIWWAEETGVDGYRLDTFPYVSRAFWADWHQALAQAFPGMTTVGEVSGSNAEITAFFAGGRAQFDGIDSGVTTVFDYPLYFALRDVLLNGAPVQRIIDVLQQDRLYPRPDLLVPFFGNHDVERFAFAKGASPERLKLAFSILLTMRGLPELYYGDEIGMTGGNDPDNRRDFPGGFPGDKQNAFVESEPRSSKQFFCRFGDYSNFARSTPRCVRESSCTFYGIKMHTRSHASRPPRAFSSCLMPGRK